MAKWDNSGIPHKGWRLVDYQDVLADPMGRYETCEMCRNEKIRFVHIMSHPDYSGTLRVGCVCAEKMTNDYATHRRHERELRNIANRRENFLKREWYQDYKGNYRLDYRGFRLMAMHKESGVWGVVLNGKWIWKYKGRWIFDFETLKWAAFELYDEISRE